MIKKYTEITESIKPSKEIITPPGTKMVHKKVIVVREGEIPDKDIQKRIKELMDSGHEPYTAFLDKNNKMCMLFITD